MTKVFTCAWKDFTFNIHLKLPRITCQISFMIRSVDVLDIDHEHSKLNGRSSSGHHR